MRKAEEKCDLNWFGMHLLPHGCGRDAFTSKAKWLAARCFMSTALWSHCSIVVVPLLAAGAMIAIHVVL